MGLDHWVAECAEVFRKVEFETRISQEEAEKVVAARRAEKRRQAQVIGGQGCGAGACAAARSQAPPYNMATVLQP